MVNQRVLEEAAEKTGAWVTKHPSGVMILQAGGETFTVFPHVSRWTYRIAQINQAPYASGFFARGDVVDLVHKIQTWAWANGVGT